MLDNKSTSFPGLLLSTFNSERTFNVKSEEALGTRSTTYPYPASQNLFKVRKITLERPFSERCTKFLFFYLIFVHEIVSALLCVFGENCNLMDFCVRKRRSNVDSIGISDIWMRLGTNVYLHLMNIELQQGKVISVWTLISFVNAQPHFVASNLTSFNVPCSF